MGALGRIGHGGHTDKARRGHLWSCRSGLGCYGRGNFPGHDVFGGLSKMVKNECGWLIMAGHGCNGVHDHGGKGKQDKKRPKWVCRACFCMCDHRAKMQHVGMDGHGDQGGARGAKEGEQRA